MNKQPRPLEKLRPSRLSGQRPPALPRFEAIVEYRLTWPLIKADVLVANCLSLSKLVRHCTTNVQYLPNFALSLSLFGAAIKANGAARSQRPLLASGPESGERSAERESGLCLWMGEKRLFAPWGIAVPQGGTLPLTPTGRVATRRHRLQCLYWLSRLFP